MKKLILLMLLISPTLLLIGEPPPKVPTKGPMKPQRKRLGSQSPPKGPKSAAPRTKAKRKEQRVTRKIERRTKRTKKGKAPVFKRRQIISNASSYPVHVKLLQAGCQKEKSWTINPKQQKSIIMVETCLPKTMTLSFPGKKNLSFLVGKEKTSGMATFEVQSGKVGGTDFVYWDIVIKGATEPLKLVATPRKYISRAEAGAGIAGQIIIGTARFIEGVGSGGMRIGASFAS